MDLIKMSTGLIMSPSNWDIFNSLKYIASLQLEKHKVDIN